VKLNEKRSRLRKAKNDHKLAVSKIRRELDNYNHRLQSGTDENRQKQRSLQLERNIRQTEEATAVLDTQIDTMENVPDEEYQEWSEQKAKYEQEVENLKSAKAELTAARTAKAHDLSSLESDLNSTLQKRERLQGRRTRVNEQYERIVSANAQGLNERERRAAEQFAREQEQAKLEASFNEQFASISQTAQDYQIRTAQLWQQCTAAEQALQQQQQQMFMEPPPLTPEGELPGTNLFTDAPTMHLSALATNSNHRSLLGQTFSALKSSPLQQASSPVGATSSHPTSPINAPSYQLFSSSPFGNAASFLEPDFVNRDRSFSNRSARSSLYGMDLFEPPTGRRPPFDPFEGGNENRRGSGSDSNPLNLNLRPISSPFQRAASRASATGSGASGGSGSGSGSPSSARGKGN
jgi:hypothetical protein